MSVPELPSKISSPDETFQASPRRLYILIDKMRSGLTNWRHKNLTNSLEMLQTMSNYMVTQHQNFELQMQPQAVPGSDLSIYKVTSQNILVSSDLATDLDPFQGITKFFREPSNIYPQT